MLVYLSGPHDAVSEPVGWKHYVREELLGDGIVCFDPMGGFAPGPNPTLMAPGARAAVMDIQTYASIKCTILFANLLGGEQTVGTMCEIDRRRSYIGEDETQHRFAGPTVVATQHDFLWLNGCDVVGSLSAGLEKIREYHEMWLKVQKAGRIQAEIHSQRWWEYVDGMAEENR